MCIFGMLPTGPETTIATICEKINARQVYTLTNCIAATLVDYVPTFLDEVMITVPTMQTSNSIQMTYQLQIQQQGLSLDSMDTLNLNEKVNRTAAQFTAMLDCSVQTPESSAQQSSRLTCLSSCHVACISLTKGLWSKTRSNNSRGRMDGAWGISMGWISVVLHMLQFVVLLNATS